jgi:hypothetical protein
VLQVCGSLLLMDVWAIAQTECGVCVVRWTEAMPSEPCAVGACNVLFVRATQLTSITQQTNHTPVEVEQYETCRTSAN